VISLLCKATYCDASEASGMETNVGKANNIQSLNTLNGWYKPSPNGSFMGLGLLFFFNDDIQNLLPLRAYWSFNFAVVRLFPQTIEAAISIPVRKQWQLLQPPWLCQRAELR